MQTDLNIQNRQRAATQGATAAQQEQAAKIRADNDALRSQRATCQHESGSARQACAEQFARDKAIKKSDAAALQADKDVRRGVDTFRADKAARQSDLSAFGAKKAAEKTDQH